MNSSAASLEALIRDSKHALVIGVGGGGDVAGALATARLLKFCGLPSTPSVSPPNWTTYGNLIRRR